MKKNIRYLEKAISSSRIKNIERGNQIIRDMGKKHKGFLLKGKKLSPEAVLAIDLVLEGYFLGPNCLETAYMYVLKSCVKLEKQFKNGLKNFLKQAGGKS